MPETKSIKIGAIQESIRGPGKIVHEGGDPILIAPVEGGLPGTETTLVFEGNEVVIDGDDEFQPANPDARTHEFDGTILVRALGQANASLAVGEEEPEDPGPPASANAKKFADDHGIDLAAVEYDGNQITVPDIKKHVESGEAIAA